MTYYCSFGDLQEELRSYYQNTGRRMQFVEAVDSLYSQGKLSDKPHDPATLFENFGRNDHSKFYDRLDRICFPVRPLEAMTENVTGSHIIPDLRDVYIIRHPRYTRLYLHRHDYVEIDYVVDGSCTYHFEDEARQLEQGDFVLTSPYSMHDIEICDESTVFCIMLRQSTFQSSFFSLMGNDDALSLFFRSVLTADKKPNYLIFKAEDLVRMELMIQDAMIECHKYDSYSNICCMNFVSLMFTCILRSNNGSPQFYRYQTGSEFASIINYISHNSATVTLASLAEEFHYSKPHMCTIIKQNTGYSFSAMIRSVRMHQAVGYLTKTDLPVSDIAEMIGYNSADHFSRVFRESYGISPMEYRRQHRTDKGSFLPFEYI